MYKNIVKIIFVIFIFYNLSFAEGLDAYAKKAWQRVNLNLDRISGLIDQHEKLPNWSLFKKDKKSNLKSINKIIESSLASLEISKLGEYRMSYFNIERSIENLKKQNENIKIKKISAPVKTTFFKSFWIKTQKDYENNLNGNLLKIEKLSQQKNELIFTMSSETKKIGLNLNERQIKFILSTVDGNDLLNLSCVFDNVKQITGELVNLTKSSGENVNIAKKYYGMYVSLNKILIYSYQKFIYKIQNIYLKKISNILEENKNTMLEAEKLLLLQNDDSSKLTLKNNLVSLQITENAAKLYEEYLNNRLKTLLEIHKKLENKYKVSLNTYKTVKLSAALASIVESSIKEFDYLNKMQLPKMIPFENKDIQEKFQQITKILQK